MAEVFERVKNKERMTGLKKTRGMQRENDRKERERMIEKRERDPE